jgi:hypothetical protein
MHSKTFLAVFALATAVAAAPVLNDILGSNPPTDSLSQDISNVLGSPFGNGMVLSHSSLRLSLHGANTSILGDGNGDAAGANDNGNVRSPAHTTLEIC